MCDFISHSVFVVVNNPCTRQSVTQEFSLSMEPASQLITLSFDQSLFLPMCQPTCYRGRPMFFFGGRGTPLRDGVTGCWLKAKAKKAFD